MNQQYPIYTVPAECHDCYKCVRHCPVKAIRIENGHASVLPNRCIACGHCVKICPSHAKRIRDDLPRVRALLQRNKSVYVSIAPSWAGVFPSWKKSQLIGALRRLGFVGVSETALGAQEVSAAVAEDLAKLPRGVFLSSACPAVVDYVRTYFPQYVDLITPVGSPAMTHAKLLKKTLGEEIGVVFIGPCAAKKNEADRHPELIDVALTFDELRKWLREEDLDPAELAENDAEHFVPYDANEGAIYPLEGGMPETIRRCGCPENVQLLSISGIPQLEEALEKQTESKDLYRHDTGPVFVECLACSGGCINGPGASSRVSGLVAASGVLANVNYRETTKRTPQVRVPYELSPGEFRAESVSADAMRRALERVGKTTPDDELNCGGCGYDSCRDFAAALIRGDAEPSMCVSWMRQMALRKANALLRCMPAGVVIVDSELKIVESNEVFAEIFGDGEELIDLFHEFPGLEGAFIDSILPACKKLFLAALRSGKDVRREHFPVGNILIDITVFTIDPGKTVGAIVQDVTRTDMRRNQIARRAQEVISRNISVVQEIACRLGEHMADTEILLNSIADGFRSEPDEEESSNADRTSVDQTRVNKSSGTSLPTPASTRKTLPTEPSVNPLGLKGYEDDTPPLDGGK